MTRPLLDIAREAAAAGADVLRARAGDLGSVRTKSAYVDMVTDVDVASGVAVVRAILGRMPEARFVVEEPEVYDLTGCAQGSLDDAEVWCIDPLDGTTSFVHGYPCYSVSIALLREGRPIVGVVQNGATGEVFAAADGAGATLDGSPIRCTQAGTIEEALIATGFPYDRGATLDRQLAVFARVIRIAHDIRRDGSAAIDCCEVACGRVDAFWEIALRPWDTAAGTCILRESGALMTDTEGRDWTPAAADVVAANPVLHARLLELIAEVDAAG